MCGDHRVKSTGNKGQDRSDESKNGVLDPLPAPVLAAAPTHDDGSCDESKECSQRRKESDAPYKHQDTSNELKNLQYEQDDSLYENGLA